MKSTIYESYWPEIDSWIFIWTWIKSLLGLESIDYMLLIGISVVESLLEPDFALLFSETHNQQLPQEVAITDAQVAATTNGQAAKNTRRLTSPIWAHFEIWKIGGVDKVKCNYCGKNFNGKSKNGTKHLHEHYKNCNRVKVFGGF